MIDRIEETFQELRDKGFVRLQPPDLAAENVIRKFFLKKVFSERPDTDGRVVSIRPVSACRTVGESICKTVRDGITAYLTIWGIEDLKFHSIGSEKRSFHISSS
ncbi:MAG: hypothetical protein M0P21_06710 [Methanoculleus sp.]|nr:hypothetical protein [Methanoculleus sp.]